jgi:hypothetical protein
MVSLRGRPRTRREPLARVGRLDQVAGVQLVEAGDGAERDVRLLRSTTGSGFGFEVLADRGFDIGRALLGGTDEAAMFNYPHRKAETHRLHGRYTGLSARLAGYGTSWQKDGCLLWAEGKSGPVLELVDLVLVLEVDPGWPGHLPAASTQSRVRTVWELAAGLDIAVQVGVDGGVTIASAAEIASWGADVVVSGSPIYDGIDPPATCAACSTSCVPQLASRTPSLAEEEAHVHQRHTPDRPAANPYEDHPDRRGSP